MKTCPAIEKNKTCTAPLKNTVHYPLLILSTNSSGVSISMLLWPNKNLKQPKVGQMGSFGYLKNASIQKPEHPERNLVVEDIFGVVFDHIAI